MNVDNINCVLLFSLFFDFNARISVFDSYVIRTDGPRHVIFSLLHNQPHRRPHRIVQVNSVTLPTHSPHFTTLPQYVWNP